jgi:hypothetical protein
MFQEQDEEKSLYSVASIGPTVPGTADEYEILVELLAV